VAKAFPGTLLEFEHWFRTDEACREYLARLRWPDGFRCSHCDHRQGWGSFRAKVRCGGCRRDTSITAGTIFQDSHLSLRLWFRAIWSVVNQKSGISALGLQRALGLGSYRTAWICLHKLRRAMVRPGREQLNGRVEVDETFVGGFEKGKGGRHVGKKAVVMIAAEVRGEGIGRVRLQQVPDTSKEHLLGFVQEMISPGTVVRTDGLSVYSNLTSMGFRHHPRVPKSDPAEATKLLPRVHRVAALLKRWLMGIHHGSHSKRQLDHYLNEFTFRFNRRTSLQRGQLFYRLLQQAVCIEPVPLDSLKRGA
jgi:transposase-like protein